jgi:hypothetical protein
MLLQRETPAVAITFASLGALCDKALRPTDEVSEGSVDGKRSVLPLHVLCCGGMKSTYNSLAVTRLPFPCRRIRPVKKSPSLPPSFVGKIPTELMDYSVA